MTARFKKRFLLIIVHVAVWMCFLLIPFIFQSHERQGNSHINDHFTAIIISSSLYLVAVFYINTQLLIPRFLFKRQWFWYALSMVALVIIFLYLPEGIANIVTKPITESEYKQAQLQYIKKDIINDSLSLRNINREFNIKKRRFHFYPDIYLIFVLVFAISTCISLVQQWLNTEETKNEIVREKLNTELSFLKSQINPHFFFNTLNNIYSLAIVGSENTAPAILKLSAIMRHIISDAQVNFVSLESEITFINHFITLQQLRLTNNVEVNFIQKGDFSQQMIAPLLFIPFVENAFKYGISTKECTRIDFYLEAKDDVILFKASNKIIQSEDDFRETTGIGINNVKRRLTLLYPNNHHLEINNNQETFSIKLEIRLR